jgi:fermentation-respiration switch protein FrsA (DUF1100 family)
MRILFSPISIGLMLAYWLFSPRVSKSLYTPLLFHPRPLDADDLQEPPHILVKLGEGQYSLVQATNHFFDSRGKLASKARLHGWLFKSPQAKDGNRRLLIFNHGNSGNVTGRLQMVEFLVRLDFDVFVYDYRGFGESSSRPSVEGVLQDGLSAYDYACSLYTEQDIDTPVYLYGESLGAAVTAYVGAHRPVDGAVLQSGFSALSAIAREKYPHLKMYPDRLFPKPALDSMQWLPRVDAPVLIVHGALDAVVPIAHAHKLHGSRSQTEFETRLEILPETAHADLLETGYLRLQDALRVFFASLPI